MFYYLYQITNLVNNKIYVGVHKTKDMNDGYMGSGKVIKRAMEKYGTGNFRKDILETFQDAKSMYAREKELVTEEFLEREDVYNLRRGGHGGFDYINKTPGLNNRLSEGYNRSVSPFVNPEKYTHLNIEEIRKKAAVSSALRMKKIHDDRKKNKTDFYEKLWRKGNSPEARAKAKKTQKETFKKIGHSIGKKNSQFGTCWISHEKFGIKKCKKTELDGYINNGWIKGRKN